MSLAEKTVAVIGAGPAGLMAAEVLSQAGVKVAVYDAMPSAGRKFLMAGKGGMNITHAEAFPRFLERYGAHRADLKPILMDFPPAALREWLLGLGIGTFVGTSGRVFPTEMKAAPLLRAWLHRLRLHGVRFHMRHRWLGWSRPGELQFSLHGDSVSAPYAALILALGGGSWPQLGSTGDWPPLLAARGVEVAALRPSNCGFDIPWSDYFLSHFAGQPIKTISVGFTNAHGDRFQRQGELTITDYGIEGGPIYELSPMLRDAIESAGPARIYLDLLPDMTLEKVHERLVQTRGKESLANHLRKRLGLYGVKSALLREVLSAAELQNPAALAAKIKTLPLELQAARPLAEAISSAGGVCFSALDRHLMLKASPGVFCAGEMLDWEAPTGGYLLTACLASGRAAGFGALEWLNLRKSAYSAIVNSPCS